MTKTEYISGLKTAINLMNQISQIQNQILEIGEPRQKILYERKISMTTPGECLNKIKFLPLVLAVIVFIITNSKLGRFYIFSLAVIIDLIPALIAGALGALCCIPMSLMKNASARKHNQWAEEKNRQADSDNLAIEKANEKKHR